MPISTLSRISWFPPPHTLTASHTKIADVIISNLIINLLRVRPVVVGKFLSKAPGPGASRQVEEQEIIAVQPLYTRPARSSGTVLVGGRGGPSACSSLPTRILRIYLCVLHLLAEVVSKRSRTYYCGNRYAETLLLYRVLCNRML